MIFRGHHKNFRAVGAVSLFIMLLMAGVVVCMCTVDAHADDSAMSSVRMEVDPTVLPPIQPPSLPEESDDDSADNGNDPSDNADVTVEEAAGESGESESAPAVEVTPLKGPGTVNSIDVDSARGRIVFELYADRKIEKTSAFNLQSPRRLVMDLPGEWHYSKENVLRPESDVIKYVVIGTHPDKLRLVVHFRGAVADDIVPQFEQEEFGLRITVPLP